ncbi:non-ribosomal peptide synthetase [Nocardia higoensis]|uniref:non-ribosomal peptide synthetase n=1 Tax=Nocardia higoensis TaxID=228599 RepID=UPI0002EB7E57|nr:non-ribosomal peptide synthetase [Nocardia higoensis]
MLGGPRTLTELLETLHHSEHTVTFADSGLTLAHRDLPAGARQVGSRLRALGAGPGDIVGLLMPTCPAWVTGFFGAVTVGAAVTGLPLPPVAPAAATAQLMAIVRAAGVRYLLAAGAGVPVAVALVEQVPGLRYIDLDEPFDGTHDRGAEPAAIEPDALAVVQFSSGSTARPKGVLLTHAQFLSGVTALIEHTLLTGDDVLVQWVPLFHDMGLVSLMTSLLTPYDAHLFIAKTFITDAAEVLRYTARVGGTRISGPNFSYDRFIAAAAEAFDGTTGEPLARWRTAVNGAEPVRPHTVREFARVFGPLGVSEAVMTPCYGMAEATLAVTIPHPDTPPRILSVDRDALVPGHPYRPVAADAPNARELVGVGVPVPGISLRITDFDGAPLPDGYVGEIRVRGQAVTSGYLGDDETTAATIVDGWLCTGDLGFLADGELVVAGRLKEMIIVAGRNFFPDDVEEAARVVPGVFRGHCVAVADTEAERMIVVAETEAGPGSPEADAAAEAIRRAVSGALALSAVTVLVVPARALPRTTSGKWQRAVIAELALTHMADRSPAEVTRVLREELARRFHCRVDRIDLGSPLTDMPGADSIRILETVVACEKRWKIRLDEDALAFVHTGVDLRDLLVRTLAAASSMRM